MDAFQKVVELIKLVLTWWFFVEPWERAICLRAGKHMRVCGPGVHFKIPVIDNIYLHNTRRMTNTCPSVTVSAQDGRVFVVSATISYFIVDVVKLHTEVHDAQGLVNQKVSQVISEFVHGRSGAAVNPQELAVYLNAIDVSALGLGGVEVAVNSFASVKTFRVVNDSLFNAWAPEQLCTTRKS